MRADELVRRLGDRLYHVTAARNGESINSHGLLTPHGLAQLAGVVSDELILRRDRRELRFGSGSATLNHQRPLRAGMSSAPEWLADVSIEDWSAQLDRRVFFWVGKPDRAFRESVEKDRLDISVYSLCTRRLIDARHGDMWLSPINSGSATRRPAPRGPWLYVSATAPWDMFRQNRRRRGLVGSPDTAVKEVSLTEGIGPDLLRALDWRKEVQA